LLDGDDFERRLLTSVDAKGYSETTANWQTRVQAGLLAVLDRAAERAGLSRETWHTQGAGDGELAVLPATEPEPRVVDDFVRHLSAELRRHNRDLPETKRLRLRLAVHFGPTIRAGNGYAGGGPITVSRLCDSPQLRAALSDTGAFLAVILSQRVFSETVQQEHTSLDPASFRKVAVRVKTFTEDAWIWVPDHDLAGWDPPDAEPTADPPSGTPSPHPPRPSGPVQDARSNFTNARVIAGKVVGGDEITHGTAG
jgi:hypothetical protein